MLIKKILALLLGVCVITPIMACSPIKPEDKGNGSDAKDTEIVLIDKGTTEYKVVLPANPAEHETLAGNELKLFIEESSGVTIEVVTDEQAIECFSSDSQIISVGNTKLLDKANISIPQELGYSGYFVKLVGKGLFIAGENELGTLYGVYDFLEFNFGIKMYGFGENHVPRHTKVLLKDFDYSYSPTFESRRLIAPHLHWFDNSLSAARLRLTEVNSNNSTRENSVNYLWSFAGHSTIKLVPADSPANFFATSAKNEICFTNEDVIATSVQTLIKQRMAHETPLVTSVMLGLMDNDSWCGCQESLRQYELYTRTGVYIRFVNEVAKRMKAWEIANNRKQLEYVAFAYRKSFSAPVKYNSSTGVYTPIHESVIPADNVTIRFGAHRSVFNRSLTDPEYNASTKAAIEGWSALTDKFYVWTYGLVYSDLPIWFNDFFNMKDHYLTYQKMGARELYDQFTYNVVNPAFSRLRLYVKSKLMWNLELDPTALAYEFSDNYYKAASPYMKQLFDFVNMRYQQIDKEMYAKDGKRLESVYHAAYEPKILTEEYWPIDFLRKCQNIIDGAYGEIRKIEDDQTRSELRSRVTMEAVSVQYLMLEIHRNKFTAEEYASLINKFERDCAATGVNATGEVLNDTTIQKKVAQYRSYI